MSAQTTAYVEPTKYELWHCTCHMTATQTPCDDCCIRIMTGEKSQ